MDFGSFAASREERVDPLLLQSVLRPGVVVSTGQNPMTLKWNGAVGKQYQVYAADSPAGPWTAGPIFTGEGTEITYDDVGALGSGRKFYKILAW
jgi:hypothetical protein